MTQIKLPQFVKVIIVTPRQLTADEFYREVTFSGLRHEQVLRADTREAAEFKQRCWADRGINSCVVTLLRRAYGQPM